MKFLLRKSCLAFGLVVVLSGSVFAERFDLDMQNVDIGEFINTVAKLTGKTIVVDSRVKGKISVESHRKLDADELYQIFLLQLGVVVFCQLVESVRASVTVYIWSISVPEVIVRP